MVYREKKLYEKDNEVDYDESEFFEALTEEGFSYSEARDTVEEWERIKDK